MALRRRLSDENANYPDPILGVNLRAAEEDLAPGEARLMKNVEYINGIVTRPGTTRITSATLDATKRIRGGHKFYYGTSSSKRLVAYGQKISVIADNGTETNLINTLTSDLDTHFVSWKITDKVYITNGTDKIYEYDGTTFQSTDAMGGASGVPNAAKMICPVLDRLLALTSGGLIERTSPRVAHQWSNGSSWATFRPLLGGGFTAVIPHTLRSSAGDLYPGALATQANALYMITGTDYGDDATAASASSGEDASIKLIDPRIGTSSPYSLCNVPGVGVFGVSSDLNVWFLPSGSASPVIIGDKIRSTGSTAGLESANLAAINQISMVYFDRRLILGFPTGTNTWNDTYFFLDMRSFLEHPDRGAVWNGPHSGHTVSRMWPETQNGENALIGGEGKPANGAFVYSMMQDGTETDAVATADTTITWDYQTFFNSFGAPSREKYVQNIQIDATCFETEPSVSLYDLNSTIATGLSLTEI
jgi:hypothetical protein